MFNSYNYSSGQLNQRPSDVGFLLRKDHIFGKLKAKDRNFFGTSSRSYSEVGASYSKLKLGARYLSIRAEVKDLSRWAAYGGRIPSILHALVAFENLDEALGPWEGNLNNKERTIILKEQTHWRRALQLFDWFKAKSCYELNVIHYNVMLRILGGAQRWDLVLVLWHEMKFNRIAPTNSTYGTLINAFCKGGLNREALVWLGELYKQGMEPDEVTMAIILQTYKKAGEFQNAEKFFMRWSSEMNNDCAVHKCYSLYTYNTLIDTYGKAGQLDKASETFGQMLSDGILPDTVTFNTIIHVCGNHGHLDQVASLMAMMDEFHCIPDTRTYNILISLYLKGDNVDMASKYFSKMKEACLVPDIVSYRTLLYAYSIRNQVQEAESLVTEMEYQGLEIDEYTQSALTRMYINVNMLDKSWSWFERFSDTMSSECFAANIDAFGQHGYLHLAEKTFTCCLNRKKLSVLVFNVMIKAYGLSKKYDEACNLFDCMPQFGIVPDKCTYICLIQMLSAAEQSQKALSYLRKIQGRGLVTDCVPYSVIIGSFAKVGKLHMAENLFKEMMSFGIQPDIVAYSILINAYAEVGNVHEAKSLVDLMNEDGFALNSIICNSLIKLYTKVGNLREAQQVYKLLKSLEDTPDVYSSNCMIDLYCEYTMVREAEEIFENLKYCSKANEFSYGMMLCLYKKLGRFDEAYKIAQEMQTLGILTSTLSYNNVISLYASDGRMMDAVKTFQQMLVSGVQLTDATFRALGFILLKHGVSRDAVKHLEFMRAEDPQLGLHEWIRAICSILRLDTAFLKHNIKLKSHLQVDPFTINVLPDEFRSIKKLREVKQGLYA